MSPELSPRFVFERFAVGPANRMAALASLQVAESPGRSHNPLVICGAAGSGKTHLLAAIAQRALRLDPSLRVRYQTAGSLVEGLSSSLVSGTLAEFREALSHAGLLLLDDLQALAGKDRTQLELLRLAERSAARGVQVVLGSDRPPGAIPSLDPALQSWLASGMVVEIAPLDPDTRRAIVQQLAKERGLALGADTLHAVSRLPIDSGHQLQAALDRLADRPEPRELPSEPSRLAELLGVAEPRSQPGGDEFESLLTDLAAVVASVVETAPWRRRLADAILRWESEGIRTRRLEEGLDADSAADVDTLIAAFERDVERLQQIGRELPHPPADPLLLRDPDRLPEAEALLEAARPTAHAASAASGEEHRPIRAELPLDPWFLDRERLAWSWLSVSDCVLEDPR